MRVNNALILRDLKFNDDMRRRCNDLSVTSLTTVRSLGHANAFCLSCIHSRPARAFVVAIVITLVVAVAVAVVATTGDAHARDQDPRSGDALTDNEMLDRFAVALCSAARQALNRRHGHEPASRRAGDAPGRRPPATPGRRPKLAKTRASMGRNRLPQSRKGKHH